mgnify:CR=1 FL=1
MSFNSYCQELGLFNPEFSETEQCSGYHQLKKMVIKQIQPATEDEFRTWYSDNILMFDSPCSDKYMQNIHPLLRVKIREDWNTIKNLKI